MINEKVPEAVLAVDTSHLILSLEPLSSAPLDKTEDVLLNKIPLSKVSSTNEPEVFEPLISASAYPQVLEADTTRVTNKLSPPFWK